MAGGLLLLWRRTTPLGSVVSAAVMLNIVLLNFCYDVSVKLFSMNLLLMAGFLAWPDLRRIANVLVLNRPTGAESLAPPWNNRAFRRFALVLITVVFGGLLFACCQRIRTSGPEFKAAPPSVVGLSGIWTVDSFKRDGALVAPLITDATRWRRVVLDDFSGGTRLIALGENNQWLGFWLVGPDSTDGNLVLRSDIKDRVGVNFALTRPGPDRIEISGTVKDHPGGRGSHAGREIRHPALQSRLPLDQRGSPTTGKETPQRPPAGLVQHEPPPVHQATILALASSATTGSTARPSK